MAVVAGWLVRSYLCVALEKDSGTEVGVKLGEDSPVKPLEQLLCCIPMEEGTLEYFVNYLSQVRFLSFQVS